MPLPPALPPGLSPITAGRFGWWLWGKKNQARAAKRRSIVHFGYGIGLANRWIKVIAPWSIPEYPGWRRLFADMLNVSVSTAITYLYHPERLPAPTAERMASICDDKIAELESIARELREYARNRSKKKGAVDRDRRGG